MSQSSPETSLIEQAIAVLNGNDRGHYTVPCHALYPFQWNWDSCFTSLGLFHINEKRAWQELETLFAHQWRDGMVPHIIFHVEDPGYFPGPEIWQTGRKTSGITQPPVAGTILRKLFERTKDRELARQKALALLPKISAWHEWFYRCRDPKKQGLVAILHPWESGRDNSIDWDAPLTSVPTKGVAAYTRKDTQIVDAVQRPTKDQYDRYLWLVQHFRALSWDQSLMHDASPFQVVDPGFNAILLRSCEDLADVARALGEHDYATLERNRLEQGKTALKALWSEEYQQYLCFDRVSNTFIKSASITGLLPVICSEFRLQELCDRIQTLQNHCQYLVPSHDPDAQEFESSRYWRGPVWLMMNALFVDGLAGHGVTTLADQIRQDSLNLVRKSQFGEYYDPITGKACGGKEFSWTAAMVLEFLKMHPKS